MQLLPHQQDLFFLREPVPRFRHDFRFVSLRRIEKWKLNLLYSLPLYACPCPYMQIQVQGPSRKLRTST
jgi:hypothetical protein